MAPIVLLVLWVASFLGPQAHEGLITEITALIGSKGGEAITLVIENARERPSLRNTAGMISLFTLVFGASAVFAELQAAMNRIWNTKPKPGRGIGGWLRKRLLSFGMLLAVLFLLLVSTILSALLAAAYGAAQGLPGGAMLWSCIHFAVSTSVFAAVFALMFRYLPDVRIQWRDVWFGGLSTALLFAVGKYAVGLYLGRSSVGSAYGAAGSLIVVLVWAYYSALIFFFGAEMTQVWARQHGRGIEPYETAASTDSEARAAWRPPTRSSSSVPDSFRAHDAPISTQQ